ncbi:MAG: hypothetical protein WKF96_17780 [Solirubrobacteraceae bacterium]
MHPKSTGLSPKVPVQAVTTVLVALLAYLGIDLEPAVSLAVATLLGFVAGYIAPPGQVR